MTVRIFTGSKEEIARQVAGLDGEVREAIVFMEEPIGASARDVPETVEEMFREMEPFMTGMGQVDDSREAIYERMEGE